MDMTIAEIQMMVAGHYGVTVDEMLGSGGELRVKRPRQVAMYVARKFTTASLPDIAAAFGRNGAAVRK